MWTGAGFRVSLETERALIGQFNPLHGVVKQGTMGNAHIFRQRVFIYLETMILAGNHYFAAIQVLHGVVCAVMTKGHFGRFRAARQTQ